MWALKHLNSYLAGASSHGDIGRLLSGCALRDASRARAGHRFRTGQLWETYLDLRELDGAEIRVGADQLLRGVGQRWPALVAAEYVCDSMRKFARKFVEAGGSARKLVFLDFLAIPSGEAKLSAVGAASSFNLVEQPLSSLLRAEMFVRHEAGHLWE